MKPELRMNQPARVPPHAWQLIVDRQDPARARLVNAPSEPLPEGALRMRVERLALTANVLTYARSGDALGFWQLFPAPGGWGCVPAWGHAVVEASTHADVQVGQRYFGLLPMASHWTMSAARSRAGLRDTSSHRAAINPVYNQYALSANADADALDAEALFRPLLITSFVLEHHVRVQRCFGAGELWITSASSKTALGLADRLQGLLPLRGFSGEAHQHFVRASGCYDTLHPYEQLAEAATAGAAQSVLLVDFSGDDALIRRIAQALSSRLVRVLRVGSTHWQRSASLGPRVAEVRGEVTQDFFFGPEHIVRLVSEWGPHRFEQCLQEALARFAQRSAGWYHHERHAGAEGLLRAYTQLAAGALSPDRLCIVRPA